MALSKNNLFLLNLLIFLTFDLMLLGAGVRTMNAGLTCPDWPLCFGKTIPDYHFGVYLEFIHRAIAGLVGLIYMGFFIKVWRTPSLKPLRVMSLIGLFFLVAQIIMGGLTVLKLLEAYIVTLHLTLATVFLVTLVLMKKSLVAQNEKKVVLKPNYLSKIFKLNIIVAIGFVIIQIVLGGMVASTYSGLVCIDFPTCNGELFPPMVGPIAIQMLHRFGAYWLATLLISVFAFSIFAWKKMGLGWKERKMGVTIFLLVFTQIFVGIMNLKYLMPAALSVFHLFLALCILLALINLNARIKLQRA